MQEKFVQDWLVSIENYDKYVLVHELTTSTSYKYKLSDPGGIQTIFEHVG